MQHRLTVDDTTVRHVRNAVMVGTEHGARKLAAELEPVADRLTEAALILTAGLAILGVCVVTAALVSADG